MLTRDEFQIKLQNGLYLLDGATGSNLRSAGMPKDCCAEQWLLEHPEPLVSLQRSYAQSGCQIIYAPTFQAQPIALARVGLDNQTEAINASLVALSKSAVPSCLIAGDITTLSTFCDSFDPECFDLLVDNYSRQIRGLLDGGADLLIAETLLYPQEAEAILTAAELEGAQCVMYSFTMQPDGSFFSGAEVGPVLRELEDSGASAVGFNCVAADEMTAGLVSKLRRYTSLPLICKPNAGVPYIDDIGCAHYSMTPDMFAQILLQCKANGASLLGGCCGTTPDYLAAVKKICL